MRNEHFSLELIHLSLGNFGKTNRIPHSKNCRGFYFNRMDFKNNKQIDFTTPWSWGRNSEPPYLT